MVVKTWDNRLQCIYMSTSDGDLCKMCIWVNMLSHLLSEISNCRLHYPLRRTCKRALCLNLMRIVCECMDTLSYEVKAGGLALVV